MRKTPPLIQPLQEKINEIKVENSKAPSSTHVILRGYNGDITHCQPKIQEILGEILNFIFHLFIFDSLREKK